MIEILSRKVVTDHFICLLKAWVSTSKIILVNTFKIGTIHTQTLPNPFLIAVNVGSLCVPN